MTPNIYTRIESVRLGLSGWCSKQKARAMASLIIGTRPKVTVEIGVWFGRSLIPMAMAHQHILHGQVVGIDPWKATASVEGQVNEADANWWNNQQNHELAYNTFTARVKELGLTDYVVIHRHPSNDVLPPADIGLLSVDGNHGEQAVMDIERYAPFVAVGGFLVADDIEWSGGSVSKAIGLLPGMGFKELYRVKNPEESWAVFQKTNQPCTSFFENSSAQES